MFQRDTVFEAVMAEAAAARLKEELHEKIAWLSKECFPRSVEFKLGEIRDKILSAKRLGVQDLRDVNFEKFSKEIWADFLAEIIALRHLDMADWTVTTIERALQEVGVPEYYYRRVPERKAEAANSAAPVQQ